MNRTVALYLDKPAEYIDLAITLLTRIQDKFAFSIVRELPLEALEVKVVLSLDLQATFHRFAEKVAAEGHPLTLYVIGIGAPETAFVAGCDKALICLVQESDKLQPFWAAYYLFRACVSLTLNSKCQDNGCVLSVNRTPRMIFTLKVCDTCDKYLDDCEKQYLQNMLQWFDALFEKAERFTPVEYENIFKLPRELVLGFQLDCKKPICFIECRTLEKKEKVKIALVQISVEFDDVLGRTEEGLYNNWSAEGTLRRAEKINTLLNFLVRDEQPDIVAFPELTVPPDFFPEYLNFSPRYSKRKLPIMIAGSHYITDKEKRDNYEGCPIIFPCGGTIISFSKYPSRFEANSVPTLTYVQREPAWILKNEYGTIGILICKDLFHVAEIYPPDVLNNLSIIICIMCSKKWDKHYEVARVQANQRFVLLNNAVVETNGGNSAFFGPVDRNLVPAQWKNDDQQRIFGMIHDTEQKESILIATFDINIRNLYAERKPTDFSRHDYNILYDTKVIPINPDGTIS